MKTTTIAAAAVFGALSAVVALLPLSVPLPLIPYLRFDAAEIPSVFAFLLYGPAAGLVATLAYWLILHFEGSFVPIGPLMKFLAVGSMLLGLGLGMRLTRPMAGRIRALSIVVTIAIALRVAAMTVANWLVIWVLIPFFLDFATESVRRIAGWTFSTRLDALFVVLAITAAFNAAHTLLSFIPALSVAGGLVTRAVRPLAATPWFVQWLRAPKAAKGR